MDWKGDSHSFSCQGNLADVDGPGGSHQNCVVFRAKGDAEPSALCRHFKSIMQYIWGVTLRRQTESFISEHWSLMGKNSERLKFKNRFYHLKVCVMCENYLIAESVSSLVKWDHNPLHWDVCIQCGNSHHMPKLLFWCNSNVAVSHLVNRCGQMHFQ